MYNLSPQIGTSSRSGYALVISMVLSAVIAGVVVSSLAYVGTEMRLTRSSAARVQAIHAAEAGVELALDAFNSALTDPRAWSEWTQSDGNYELIITNLSSSAASSMGCGFYVTANTNNLTITAQGEVSSIYLDTDIMRTVQVEIEPDVYNPFLYGMLGKSHVQLTGNSFMDSFDSSDSSKSTDGQYDASKAQANITVATMSSDPDNAIQGAGNTTVRGDLQTAEGGGLQSGGNFSYTGNFSDDLDVDIPDVTVPWSLSPPYTRSININNARSSDTITITEDTDMEFEDINISGSGSLTLAGTGLLRMFINDSLQVSGNGEIVIDNGDAGDDLKVEIYSNGRVQLTGLVLGSGLAEDLMIFGTTNCTHIQYSGRSDFIGTVYAPQANFHVSGQGGMSGAVVGDTVQMTGQGDFHYDESLKNITFDDAASYDVISWIEL
jgi:Tfp pilus assembly protein PilX